VATEPLLTFTCPKTKERASVDIETDAQTLRAVDRPDRVACAKGAGIDPDTPERMRFT
jgi:hypothetical protein